MLALMMSLKVRCRRPMFMSSVKSIREAGVVSSMKAEAGIATESGIPTTPLPAMSSMVLV